MARRRKAFSPGEYPAGGTQRDLAEYWGRECARAIRRAIQAPGDAAKEWDHWLFHAERCARTAAYHAYRSDKSIRVPDDYERAVAAHRERRRAARREATT